MRRKLKGYVLLESMFSMVIIMLCFGVAIQVINTITNAQSNILTVRAEIALKSEAEICKAEQEFIDDDIAFDEFTVQRKIKHTEKDEHIAILELKAINKNGKVMAEYYEFIFVR